LVALIGSLLLSAYTRYNYIHIAELYIFAIEIAAIKLLIFWRFNLYKGMWRYTSIIDVVTIIKANTVASLVLLIVYYIFRVEHEFSSIVFIPDMFISISLITFIRMCIRIYFEGNIGYLFLSKILANTNVMNIIIIGANDTSEKFAREMSTVRMKSKYNLIGFIDDDAQKLHKTIHGYKVLGNTDHIQEIARHYEIDEILIAISNENIQELRKIIETCSTLHKPYHILESIDTNITKQTLSNRLRNVTYEDLIKREPLEIDEFHVEKIIEGKKIFVTGAAGSIGSELCRQLIKYHPKKLVLCDINESGLFMLSHELNNVLYHKTKVIISLCDISKIKEVEQHIKKIKPDYIFHAAAYKHVPIMESHVDQAIKTNIIGTKNMLELARLFKIKKFILISTDKAVNPIGIMGASKKIAENLATLYSHISPQITFTTVRFGNVIGSAGSVIPLFQKQIELGLPITLTSRKITRYFMSIPEASKLILQATIMTNKYDTYALDMGKPIKILDLISDLLRLNQIDSYDIKIKNIGLRPGEKLDEQLTNNYETIENTSHKKINRIIDSRNVLLNPVIAHKNLKIYNQTLERQVNPEAIIKKLLALSD